MKTCSEGPGFIHHYVHSPCNLFVKNYTKVFYMTCRGGVSILSV